MIDLDCGTGDLGILRNDLATEDTLKTAIMLSLFTDRRATAEGEEEARGWWADCVADVKGDQHGSRLWLLDRAKRLPDTLRLAEEYAREALAWLVADKQATTVSVVATFADPAPHEPCPLELLVTITLPSGLTRTYDFGSAGGTWL